MSFSKFHEHIVRVPVAIARAPFTVQDLLEGIKDFVYHPDQYQAAIEGVRLEGNLESGSLYRVIDFGNFKVKDRVTQLARQFIFDVMAQENIAESRFTVSVETPEENALFVRFIYEEEPRVGEEAMEYYVSLRRSAYEQKDKDLVARILERHFAQSEAKSSSMTS